MLQSGHNISGAMQNLSGSSSSNNRMRTRDDDYIVEDDENEVETSPNTTCYTLSPYLILSPSSPVRAFAISFLTHWIYSSVIIVTICAFLISSVYSSNFNIDSKVHATTEDFNGELGNLNDYSREAKIFIILRWILFIVLLLEMVIKLIARGFLLTGKFAYLRMHWDWLDISALALIFVSIIARWKGTEFAASAIVLIKLIPIVPGSINAFIFLYSCAKKLIPVLVYGLIIVWLYGVVIFTLFIKYQQQEALVVPNEDIGDPTKYLSKSNESTSDILNENKGTLQKNLVSSSFDVEGDLLPSTLSAHEKTYNFSNRLTMECLPTNFRSLSGSLIQGVKMLTLQNYSHLPMESASLSFRSSAETSCQFETYILSIIETLVIMSGTVPMISMTFSAFLNLFQKLTSANNISDYTYRSNHPALNRSESGESGGSQQRHDKNCQDTSSLSSCFSSLLKGIANILCDCDYYFCCLASLQRKLNPCASASGLLNSYKFKVVVLFIVSTDFVSMILLLCFIDTADCTIDFSNVTSTSLIICCVKICFALYTVEAVFKWCALTADEYWMNVWSAFDLFVVLLYWIGYAVIQWGFYTNHCLLYTRFCGILMIRMLKVAPYWPSLEQSLKLTWLSILGNRHNLFVILICSFSSFLLKCATTLLAQWTSQVFPVDLISPTPLDFYTIVESIFQLFLCLLCILIISTIYFHVFEALKTPVEGSPSNPSISFLLNNHRDSQFSEMTIMSSSTHHLQHNSEPRQSFNESSSPISVMHGVTNSIHHRSKNRLASSPCESNNGLLLTPDTRSIMSPRGSDVLSPLLTVPAPNGLNGHAYNLSDGHSHLSDENVHLGVGNTNPNLAINRTRSSFFSFSSTEDVLNLTSAVLLVLSCMNIALETSNQMTWRSLSLGRSLWIEVAFIMCIAAHIIYKTRLVRFSRETFLQISTLVDLIIILAASAEVYSTGMRWVPTQAGSERNNMFLQCAKVLSASRGLLLISRISWLQSIGSGLCYLFWKLLKQLIAFGFIWTIFIASGIEAQKMLVKGLGKDETYQSPISERMNTTTNDTNGNETMSLLTKTATLTKEADYSVHSVLWAISVFFLWLNSGVLLGFLHYKLENWSKLFEKFMTPSQVASQRAKIWQSQTNQFSFPVPDPMAKPTKGLCVPIMFYVTNHRTFDFIVLLIILLDGAGITLEHLATSDRAMVLRKHYPAYMLFLYSIEIMSKLTGNGLKFFKSYWNIFDCIIISVCLVDFLICLLFQNWISLLIQNLRFLRILRIFQFTPFVRKTLVIQGFFRSIPKVTFVLWNFGTFYFCLYLSTSLVRVRCSFPTEEGELWEIPVISTLSNPFLSLSLRNILECFGNYCLASSSFPHIFYIIALVLFSIIKFVIVFCVCLVLAIVLTQYFQEEYTKASTCNIDLSRSISFHHADDNDDDLTTDHVHNADVDEKSTYLMPCITPDTSHDLETPTSSAAVGIGIHPSSSLINSNTNEENSSSGLYNTTTFTSTREINGCKVFFVEAMITTV